jgi:hypothetical protein
MIRKLIFIIQIAALLVLSGCDRTNSTPATIADYFPAKTNVYYEYEYSGASKFTQQVYNLYIDGNRIQRLLTNSNSPYTYTEVLELADGGLRLIFGDSYHPFYDDITTVSKELEVLVMQEPLQVGTAWAFDTLNKSQITSLKTRVSTPSGDYDALEITLTSNDLVQKEYYAKGVGFVKSIYTYKDGREGIEVNLQKLTEGAAYEVDYNYYYPGSGSADSAEDHATETRTLTLNTNCDLAKLFEAEFKKPAAGASAGLIGDDISITAFSVDWQAFDLALETSAELSAEAKAAITLTLNEFIGTKTVSFNVSQE